MAVASQPTTVARPQRRLAPAKATKHERISEEESDKEADDDYAPAPKSSKTVSSLVSDGGSASYNTRPGPTSASLSMTQHLGCSMTAASSEDDWALITPGSLSAADQARIMKAVRASGGSIRAPSKLSAKKSSSKGKAKDEASSESTPAPSSAKKTSAKAQKEDAESSSTAGPINVQQDPVQQAPAESSASSGNDAPPRPRRTGRTHRTSDHDAAEMAVNGGSDPMPQGRPKAVANIEAPKKAKALENEEHAKNPSQKNPVVTKYRFKPTRPELRHFEEEKKADDAAEALMMIKDCGDDEAMQPIKLNITRAVTIDDQLKCLGVSGKKYLDDRRRYDLIWEFRRSLTEEE